MFHDADPPQHNALPDNYRQRRGHDFYPEPEAIAQIPPLTETEGTPTHELVVHLHYFTVAGSDWFVTELNPRDGMAFGWARINVPYGEWGLFRLPDLANVSSPFLIQRDLYFTPTRVGDIPLINVANRAS
ncbi:DUF2958 domain-containing protein [Streptomyces sp. NA02950]|uniref:DUF2958 domain-containing protein n=1 Tax=Streptomyces sp. NA02950 TaxID=2742137 RepID=UPI00158FABB1|nr:DUF2958 domain-containing protein [Streptomyces sp. NA02950]QKV90370.1 DUF2958 domain-containing protein [Streptomyces sp. NA02950]QKV97297.1 DUF2958 domain-containing protein [Streptomyces sp. NA02950]